MSLQAIELIIPLFLLIFLGYVFRKTGFVRVTFADDLNRIVFYIALPATLFLETADLPVLSGDILIAAVSMVVVVVVTAAIALVVSFRLGAPRRGAFVQATYRSNLAYLGIPIVSTLLGPESFGIIAVAIAAGVATNTITSILVLRLFQEDGEAMSVSARAFDIAKNPLIVAIALGLVMSAISLPMPELLADTLGLLSRVSLPLILLVVGFRLSFRTMGTSLVIALSASMMKLVVMPAILFVGLTWIVEADPLVRAITVLLVTMPTAVISQSFAGVFNADEKLAAAAVSMTTLLAAITVPVWAMLLA